MKWDHVTKDGWKAFLKNYRNELQRVTSPPCDDAPALGSRRGESGAVPFVDGSSVTPLDAAK